MANRKKLYFDINFTMSTGGFAWALAPCTPNFPSAITRVENTIVKQKATERYSGSLDALPALTAGSPPETKRRNAVSAWFTLLENGFNQASAGRGLDIKLYFVRPLAADPTDSFKIQGPPSVSGSDAVYATEFGVAAFFGHIATSSISTIQGVLYVQRQHSIEV